MKKREQKALKPSDCIAQAMHRMHAHRTLHLAWDDAGRGYPHPDGSG